MRHRPKVEPTAVEWCQSGTGAALGGECHLGCVGALHLGGDTYLPQLVVVVEKVHPKEKLPELDVIFLKLHLEKRGEI